MTQDNGASSKASIPSALWHYSATPTVLDDREYSQKHDRTSERNKPRGLWVSVEGEDDWPSWCIAEQFCVDQLEFRHSVTLAGNFLTLAKPSELRKFEVGYGFTHRWGHAANFFDIVIDWERVAKDFDGILIAPYHWECRLENEWYYGWDCASGCIWNLAAISLGPAQAMEARQGRDADSVHDSAVSNADAPKGGL